MPHKYVGYSYINGKPTGGGPQTLEVNMFRFENISTRELLAINAQHVRWYEADPTDANKAAVIQSGSELTRRGA